MYFFINDYSEGCHPKILKALTETNEEQTVGYGCDEYCAEAADLILKELDAPQSKVYFFSGGTQTNLTMIASVLRPHQGVIAADTGHINVHESGAIEACGHKVLTIESANGKITADQADALIKAHYDDPTAEHMVQPGIIYISNPTELGTIYSKKELQALKLTAQKYSVPLYVDGARLGTALTADKNDLSLADMARYTDAFYIGGTKMGALFGEALIINNQDLQKDFRYIQKQKGGLFAKGRLLGLQFKTLFTDKLYFEIGRTMNETAKMIRKGFSDRGFSFFMESETNQSFPIIENSLLAKIEKEFKCEFWAKISENQTAVRFCTSWATTKEAIKKLFEYVDEIKSNAIKR
ncbi:aminotransferase class I/II-fold pyridoxal phosphate-dependent enzyme [Treponema denticola]|uniref:threonine aldolase family protein n=1 Tax=Treponema denticola TaxID=158 RepID=UPI0021F817E6|nr:aminotransferase class I/II-fold pyridoxal phosphate-dependent enzyme [Treponema denticola]UYT07961.1 aminotransferase class I/II-fold pyridoxal phosphate-dependent enzyme [Treponema denticola]